MFQDRIKELRRVPAKELLPNPKNWRTHPNQQRKILNGILSEIGYADALLARELPDGSLQLIDGHLRAEVSPNQNVPVLILNVTEKEADQLLAVFDPLTALAQTNQTLLNELVQNVETQNEAVREWLNEQHLDEQDCVNPAITKKAGLTQSRSLEELYQIIVTCRDEDEQRTLYEQLHSTYDCRIVNL